MENNFNLKEMNKINSMLSNIEFLMCNFNDNFPTREGSLAYTKLQESIMWFFRVNQYKKE